MVSRALVASAYRDKVRRLAGLGIDLTAVVPSAWKEGGQSLRFEPGDDTGYELQIAPIAWNGHFHLHYFPTLPSIIRSHKPDIVHVDEEPYNLATYATFRSIAGRTTQGLFFTWQNLDKRYPPPFSFFESAVYRRASYGLAGSTTALELLRKRGYQGRGAVIPQFGVDLNRFSPGTEPAGEFTVGYLGRLVPEKGLDDLCEAMGRIKGSAHLVIAGSGPLRTQLKTRCQGWGSQLSLELMDSIPSDEVASLLRRFHVLVLPSRSGKRWTEQFGRVLIEAMASGVPVVGSSSGQIPSVVADAGIIFPEGDVASLAASLQQVRDDKAFRSELRSRGLLRVRENYSQEIVAQKTAVVYSDMLRNTAL